jgi:hypothetical protein
MLRGSSHKLWYHAGTAKYFEPFQGPDAVLYSYFLAPIYPPVLPTELK